MFLLTWNYELDKLINFIMPIFPTDRERNPIYEMKYWSQVSPFTLRSLNQSWLWGWIVLHMMEIIINWNIWLEQEQILIKRIMMEDHLWYDLLWAKLL